MLQQTVKKSVSEQDCTHLLFSGPLDSGKKTLIMALLRQLSASSSEKGLIASYLSCIGLKWPPTSARIGNVTKIWRSRNSMLHTRCAPSLMVLSKLLNLLLSIASRDAKSKERKLDLNPSPKSKSKRCIRI
ncbi:uncharacterized protein LOC115694323 isoform X2 [Syzygium oleosum]|uniref:uncharacterized protein LOC115694323 isoform X2 n=2 Tax=Syzygium oleosum TaxID=219896 RepID=UPI0024BA75CB|nr:uncharacterized protein LOC115694323 isoform X2 [Syzygium oleosum]